MDVEDGGVEVILVALGSNLAGHGQAGPRETCEAALEAIDACGLRVVGRSRWWRTAPVPASDQPWFCNGVARVETGLAPAEVLALLHGIEDDFGRVRRVRNEARVIDLDLLAHGDRVEDGAGGPILPHPRLTAAEMLRDLPPGQEAVPDDAA
jgi:2-amino-4-hydroxy-6-hydroxymethyldihydropteridine diphosphokinase